VSAAHAPAGRRWVRGLAGLLVLALIASGIWFALQKRGATEAAVAASGADSTATDSTATTEKSGSRFSFGRGKKKDKSKSDPVPVELAAVVRRDVPSFFTGTASIEAEQQADVLAKASGTVLKLLVEEGDDVSDGAVLLELDAIEYEARREESRVRAESQRREFERIRSLHEKGLASDREFEESKLLMETAQAQLHVSDITLGYTRVRAPFAGRVTRRIVNAGQNVQVGTHLFSIADLQPLLARIHMPEKEVERIRIGQDVRIVPDARPDESFTGRVTLIAPAVDMRTGTIKVTVAIDKGQEQLRPGAFVRAQITTDVHPLAMVIPKRALVSEGGETFVFRAAADSVVRVRVETGYTDERMTEIVAGLSDADRVVTVGQGAIRHGTKVRELVAARTDTAAAVVRR